MVLYFAYGSNMLTARLAARLESVRPLGNATAAGCAIAFEKLSIDGSAKATLKREKGAAAHGVLFEVPAGALAILDAIEGPGYEVIERLAVRTAAGDAAEARTYIAHSDFLTGAHLPYTWYRALTLAGAGEHKLPDAHVAWLKAHPAMEDPDPNRDRRLEALELLKAAGYSDPH